METLACIMSLIFTFTTTAEDLPRAKLAGRSVEMKLVKPDDLSPVPWPKATVELTDVPTTLEGSNTFLKLKANGIAPDSEALTLVYDLNPSIRDLNSVPSNAQIRMPLIETESSELKKFLRDGYLVEITVDPEIRQELNSRIDALQGLGPQIQATTTDEATLEKVKQTIGWFQEIERRFRRRTGPPLRQVTLQQMNEEADQLCTILQGVIQQHGQLTDSDKRQIGAIFGDMRIAIKEYGQTLANVVPAAEQLYSVTVTIKGTSAALINGLRVYYTFNGLFRPLPANPPIKATGFTQLGSGKSQNFLMKNYQIWAAKDGDPNHPLTTSYALDIDETSKSPISVELSLVAQP